MPSRSMRYMAPPALPDGPGRFAQNSSCSALLRIPKQYLIKGYAINERIRKEQIGELRQLVQVVGRTISNQELPNTSESQDLLDVVVDYTYALDTLDNYDYERLSIDRNKNNDNNKILIRCAPKRRTFLLSLHRELKKVRRWKIKRQGHQRKSIC